jgi:hypothetical protein
MNEQQRAAMKLALAFLQQNQHYIADNERHAYVMLYNDFVDKLEDIISQDALDKKADNARELGLDYEPARQDVPETNFGNMAHPDYAWPTIEQRAVIQQMVDALDHADELLGGNDTLVMNGAAAGRWLLEQPAVQEPVKARHIGWDYLDNGQMVATYAVPVNARIAPDLYTTPPAPQPVPVKTYHDGKPWPVAPKPWVGLTDEERNECTQSPFTADQHRAIEAKLKEKNT